MAVSAARREDGVPSESVQSTEPVDEEDGDEGEVVTELWLSSSNPSAAIALLLCLGKKSEKVVESAAMLWCWWWLCWCWRWLLLQLRSMVLVAARPQFWVLKRGGGVEEEEEIRILGYWWWTAVLVQELTARRASTRQG